MIFIGIDPGLVVTAIALIDMNGKLINTSYIKTNSSVKIQDRLCCIYDFLNKELSNVENIICAGIENSLININPKSLIDLAFARSICLLICGQKNIQVKEYLPTNVKKSITGNGNASKESIAHMIPLHIQEIDLSDKNHHEIDAIAIGLCCFFDEINMLR